MSKFRFALLALAVAAMAVAIPRPAHAWRVFFGFPYPLYVGPPVYYAPPYYAPPVAYAPPGAGYGPQVYDPSAGRGGPAVPQTAASCDAGAYVCPLDQPLAAGSPCSCPANRGRVSGTVR
jgi:hypothetical protein